MARGDHATVAGTDDLARVEGEARHVAVRPADLLPLAVPKNLAADRARGVLDERNAVATSQGNEAAQVAGHANLMHAQDGSGARRDGLFDERRVDVVGERIDVDEHRLRADVTDAVGGGDVRVTDGDHFVAALHSGSYQREMEGSRATGNGASMWSSDEICELPLERRDLGALGDPPAEDHAARGVGLRFAHYWLRNRNHD